jgi:hypothetical protein
VTSLATRLRYRRSPGALWRDTGEHVVVLLHDGPSDVKVIGGGGALLWRLLDEPATTAELMAEFQKLGGSPPSPAEIEGCLSDLADQQLLQTIEES